MTQLSFPFNLQNLTPEDVTQVMQNFQAIAAILNGELSDDNFNPGANLSVERLALGAADTVLQSSGSLNSFAKLTNDHIAAVAAILVSKLAPGAADTILRSDGAVNAFGKLTNANVDAAAAIAYAKLALANSIVNADVAAAAAIIVSKLAAGTDGQELATVGSTPTWRTVPACRAFHNAVQTIAVSTATSLALNSERFDTDEIHDLAVNNTRLTCKTAGRYQISGAVRWETDTSGYRQLSIELNGLTLIASDRQLSAGADITTQTISTLYELAVNDFVELEVFHNVAGGLDVLTSGNYSPEFMMARVG